MKGQLDVKLKPTLAFNAFVRGQGINPGVLQADWPGKLALALDARGETLNDELLVELDTLTVSGELRDLPISLDAKGKLAGSNIAIDTFALRSGPTAMDVRGQVADQLDLQWSLNSPDLSTLLPDARGNITGEGSLSGTASHPVVVAKLNASDIAYQDNALKKINT